MKLKNTGTKPVFTETGLIMPGEVYTCDKTEGATLAKSPHLEVVKATRRKKK